MAATYSGDPSNSDNDWVRDKSGDVDSDAFLLTDEEIAGEIADQSNLYVAAANCCYKIITRLGEYDKLAAMFQKRGDLLLSEANRKRFSSVTATVGTVKDVATYPDRFVHGEEHPVGWDIDT
jgi:hypothetical protein